LVVLTQARTILELGTSIGFSTLWLALGASETSGHVYTTEIFLAKAMLAKENFARAGVNSWVTLLEEDILSVLQRWNPEQKIDLVFMDADKQRYCQYFDLLYQLLRDGGLVVVDNAGNYQQYMADFIARCRELKGDVVHFLDIDNGLLLIVKGGGTNLAPTLDLFHPNK